MRSLTRRCLRVVSTVSAAPRKKDGASASRSANAPSRSPKGVSGSRVKSKPLRVPLIAIYPCTDCASSFSSLPGCSRAPDSSRPDWSSIHSVPIRYWKQDVENAVLFSRDGACPHPVWKPRNGQADGASPIPTDCVIKTARMPCTPAYARHYHIDIIQYKHGTFKTQ